MVLSPSFGQLLFYSAESGVAQFYEMDPHDTMTLRRTFGNWRTDWSLIQAGNFADHVWPITPGYRASGPGRRP